MARYDIIMWLVKEQRGEKQMDYILILLMCVFATAKMSFQTSFGKNSVKNSTDALTFNIFVFVVSALIFLPKLFGCSPQVWIFGVVGAVFAVAYQLLYTKALSVGNVSLTVLITNFSMVVCVLVSYIFFDEPISWIRLLGILLTVASFVICNGLGTKERIDKKWLVLAVLAMLSSAAGAIVSKCLGESPYSRETQAYISSLYIIAAVLAILIYPIMAKKEKRTFKIGFDAIKYAAAVGICLGLFQAVYNYGIANIDGTFLFPAQSCGTIILSTLSGVLIFKDKLTKRQVLGIAVGIVALVIMNF